MPKIDITENTDKYITTPKGELNYTVIDGQGKLDYNGTNYEFTSALHLSGEDAKAFKKRLLAVFNEYKPRWFTGDKPTNKWFRTDKNDDSVSIFSL